MTDLSTSLFYLRTWGCVSCVKTFKCSFDINCSTDLESETLGSASSCWVDRSRDHSGKNVCLACVQCQLRDLNYINLFYLSLLLSSPSRISFWSRESQVTRSPRRFSRPLLKWNLPRKWLGCPSETSTVLTVWLDDLCRTLGSEWWSLSKCWDLPWWTGTYFHCQRKVSKQSC